MPRSRRPSRARSPLGGAAGTAALPGGRISERRTHAAQLLFVAEVWTLDFTVEGRFGRQRARYWMLNSTPEGLEISERGGGLIY